MYKEAFWDEMQKNKAFVGNWKGFNFSYSASLKLSAVLQIWGFQGLTSRKMDASENQNNVAE